MIWLYLYWLTLFFDILCISILYSCFSFLPSSSPISLYYSPETSCPHSHLFALWLTSSKTLYGILGLELSKPHLRLWEHQWGRMERIWEVGDKEKGNEMPFSGHDKLVAVMNSSSLQLYHCLCRWLDPSVITEEVGLRALYLSPVTYRLLIHVGKGKSLSAVVYLLANLQDSSGYFQTQDHTESPG